MKGGKGKKAPAAPAAARLSEDEARTGIAAAMQGDGIGADDGPEGSDPAVGDAAGGVDGRATSPDAGASDTSPALVPELVKEARNIVLAEKKASISFLQRKLKIGYNAAASLLDILEKQGVVGPMGASGIRTVFVPVAAWPFPKEAA